MMVQSKKQRPIYTFLYVVFLGVMMASVNACDGSDWKDDIKRATMVIENGDRVVVALDKFKQKNGDYPSTLENLVPEFIDKTSVDIEGYRQFVYFKVPVEKETDNIYGYTLSIFRDEASLMGDRTAQRIFYTPSENYSSDKGIENVKVMNGWALQNMRRTYQ